MQGDFTTGRFRHLVELCDHDDLPPTQEANPYKSNTDELSHLSELSHASERSHVNELSQINRIESGEEFNYSLDMADRITYVPVEWILKNLTGSVDLEWDEHLEEPGHLEEPEHLIIDIVKMKVRYCATVLCNIEKYGFIYPIVIQTDRTGSHFTMGNGHHRLTAAIFMYLDTIPVYFSTSEDYMCYEYSTGAELNSSLEDIPYIEELLEDIYIGLCY